jgi:Leucine-rich repeat (LRR) protein
MSHNSLEHIYELVDLKALKKLNLAHNQIVELCSSDLSTNQDIEILPVSYWLYHKSVKVFI